MMMMLTKNPDDITGDLPIGISSVGISSAHHHDHDHDHGDDHDTYYDIIIDNGAFQLKVIILP